MRWLEVAWAARSVKKTIKRLRDRDAKRQALEAYEFLLSKEDCAYADFIEEHKKFLAGWNGRAEEKLKRPLEFLEREGLECAVWPHLCRRNERWRTAGRRRSPRRG